MVRLTRKGRSVQRKHLTILGSALCVVIASIPTNATADDPSAAVIPIAESVATTPDQMKPYTEVIEHTSAKIEMIPIPGGTFLMGSPLDEADRKEDEGPQRKVAVEPFWMSKYETTWDAYEVWMFDLDVQRRKLARLDPNARDTAADEYQVSQPTEPYTDMSFGMGKKGYPAICMTQLAARTFCQWLSAKTGRYYRLPTEAEWEYACRAGSTTAYSFGNDPDELADYAWSYDNSDDKYHQVGKKKPNPWGLYDMHGNVSEWVLDQYLPDAYAKFSEGMTENPLAIPTTLYPRVVRGGSWFNTPSSCRRIRRLRWTSRVSSTIRTVTRSLIRVRRSPMSSW